MPAISLFLTKTFLFQFSKRDHTQNPGEDDSDSKSPAVMIGLVIAALTLLVAMVPVFRCKRFHAWISSSSIPSFVKKALGSGTLPNPPSTTTTPEDDSSAIPIADVPISGPAPVHNEYSNIHPASTHSNAPPHPKNANTGEDGRVRQVEEFTGPRRPEPVITREFVSSNLGEILPSTILLLVGKGALMGQDRLQNTCASSFAPLPLSASGCHAKASFPT
ncbi:hypothetical protein HOY82DRAFT_638458 [Tuber indicum]|nr:hypothetical protein HOY82DRAFT_638458 [Tuber indicum]